VTVGVAADASVREGHALAERLRDAVIEHVEHVSDVVVQTVAVEGGPAGSPPQAATRAA
jgi:divalent metal cation (Fe/Co/Zn/Cd) transporter